MPQKFTRYLKSLAAWNLKSYFLPVPELPLALFITIVAALVGVGFRVVAYMHSRDEARIASACFLLAALVAGGWVFMWGITTPQNFVLRLIVCVTSFGLIGWLAVEAVRYVGRQRETKVQIAKAAPEVASPTTTPAPIPDVFKSAYEEYKDKLGTPKPAKEIELAYYAKHEQAWVIWLYRRKEIYLLGTNNKWNEIPDEFVRPKEEETYLFDEANRKKLKTPKGKLPPYGAIAKAQANNPKIWDMIGGREWHCFYYRWVVQIQEFERGLIIGGFRPIPENEKLSVVYVLTNDDSKWKEVQSDGVVPPCIEPPTDKLALEEWVKTWRKDHPE
ncbi:MAG TPA: hypothetical protein VGC66_07005 [Pyrinomonadaceae bacterium]